ncbi:hypothetical protein JY651_14035 [Pyxidicoccus parkwayensis]|jgi:hypothetical protein|uniref:Uncharacterized protein n=1 Tax=Pyxidicoccus parkwayensis TaxID=2813578 RepID=A0ABX7P678_9BACT|nr:hypothetical protein [Pyxidicoccus parkwaysis]QSQ25971.1 hypothetical protein JY651_14035 [Pyxidicoccus parkwaysis]
MFGKIPEHPNKRGGTNPFGGRLIIPGGWGHPLNSLIKGTRLLIIIEDYAGEYGSVARLNITKN